VADNARPFLIRAGHVSGHVGEREKRDVEGVTETDEARRLVRSIDVENARKRHGIVGDDAHGTAHDADQSNDDVRRPLCVELKQFTVVGNRLDNVFHIVGARRFIGNDFVELWALPVGGVRRFSDRQRRMAAVRQVRQQFFDFPDAVLVVFCHDMAHTALGGVCHRSSQVFL